MEWRSPLGCVAETSDDSAVGHRHYAAAFKYVTFATAKTSTNFTIAAGATLLPGNGVLAPLLMLVLAPGRPSLRLQVDRDSRTYVNALQLNGTELPLTPYTVTQVHSSAPSSLPRHFAHWLPSQTGRVWDVEGYERCQRNVHHLRSSCVAKRGWTFRVKRKVPQCQTYPCDMPVVVLGARVRDVVRDDCSPSRTFTWGASGAGPTGRRGCATRGAGGAAARHTDTHGRLFRRTCAGDAADCRRRRRRRGAVATVETVARGVDVEQAARAGASR